MMRAAIGFCVHSSFSSVFAYSYKNIKAATKIVAVLSITRAALEKADAYYAAVPINTRYSYCSISTLQKSYKHVGCGNAPSEAHTFGLRMAIAQAASRRSLVADELHAPRTHHTKLFFY